MQDTSISEPRNLGGANEIVLPIDLDTYQKNLEPSDFHALLSEFYMSHPQCFPTTFEQGYELKDSTLSKKMNIRIRRISIPTDKGSKRHYRVVPCDVLPYLCGKTQDVETPLFLRKFNVPYWALARCFGRDANYYYRLETRMGRASIVGCLRGTDNKLPEHLCCDEKHAKHLGDKIYIPTTTGEGCVLGVDICSGADTESLAKGYGVVAREIEQTNPEHETKTINVDGFAATTAAMRLTFGPTVVLLTCFLHLYISLRDRCSKKERQGIFRTIAEKLWGAYRARRKTTFAQRWRRLMEWVEEHKESIPGRVYSKLQRATKNKLEAYKAYYDNKKGKRVSTELDRLMGLLDRRLFAIRHLHGKKEKAVLLVRAWANLYNFAPWNPRTVKKNKAQCPAEKWTGVRYRECWLENFRVASSTVANPHPLKTVQ